MDRAGLERVVERLQEEVARQTLSMEAWRARFEGTSRELSGAQAQLSELEDRAEVGLTAVRGTALIVSHLPAASPQLLLKNNLARLRSAL